MAVSTGAATLIGSLLSAAASGTAAAVQGNQQRVAARKEARLVEQEAQQEAERAEEASQRLKTRQKLSFLASGVSLKGSPLLVLEETEEEGQRQSDAIINRGGARSQLLRTQGRTARNQGIASFVGSLGRASQTLIATQ